jgi:hypothetical protein
MRAIGSEFEFMNMAAAMANERCERLRRKAVPRTYAAIMETPVVIMKKKGMIHSSLSFSVLPFNGEWMRAKQRMTYLATGRKRL